MWRRVSSLGVVSALAVARRKLPTRRRFSLAGFAMLALVFSAFSAYAVMIDFDSLQHGEMFGVEISAVNVGGGPNLAVVLLIFSGVVCVAQMRTALRAPVAAYLGGHRRQRKQAERLATLQQRLAYLSEYETNWLLCCIRDGRQTLVAWQGNSVATSLAVKGIVVPGSGHLMRIPFTIPDELWQYILSNKERFLKDRAPEAVRRIVEEFKDGFHIA